MLKLFFIFISFYYIITNGDELDDFLNESKTQKPISTQEITNVNMLPRELVVKNKEKLKPEQAEPPFVKKIVSSSKNWTLLTANPKGNEMCYTVVFASKRIGNMTKPKEGEEELKSYLMVHYFSRFKQRVSIFFNFQLQRGSKVFVSVDGTQFELVSYGEYAFAEEAEIDKKLIKALERAKKVLARGEEGTYNYSVDEYDVSGFLEIYSQMQEKCGEM